MPPPVIPSGDSLDGSETLIALQGGKLRKFMLSMLRRRLERYTASITGSLGQATITFTTPFSAVPWVQPVNAVIGGQLFIGVVTSATTTGATLTFYRTKGTLLVNASAVELAPAGTPVSCIAFGS